MSADNKAGYISELRGEYRKIADAHARAQEDKVRLPLTAARANALQLDWSGAYVPPKPSFLGSEVLADYPIADLVEIIDWTPFFQTWELSGRFPAILDDAKVGEAARSLYNDARAMLDKIVAEKWFKAQRRARLLAGQQRRRRHSCLCRRDARQADPRAARPAPAIVEARRPLQRVAVGFRRAARLAG